VITNDGIQGPLADVANAPPDVFDLNETGVGVAAACGRTTSIGRDGLPTATVLAAPAANVSEGSATQLRSDEGEN
jgi:hypothetical protein